MLKLCKITVYPNGTLGLHLSRAPWDPYPWISGVQDGSNAYQAGVRTGDAVLELNGCDVLGQRISELAAKIQSHWEGGRSYVSMLIWRSKTENSAVNQASLQKFAECLQNVAQLLECPICLEIVKPPGWQCCNGHVLCNSCRGRTVKCPICRVTLGPRGRCLLSDKLFTLLAESFPCDGVKNGNSLSRNYKNDCLETPLIKTKIDNSAPSSPSPSSSCTSISSCSSSSPLTLAKVYQRKQLTENTIPNHLKKPNNNNSNENNKLAADSKSTTPDDVEDDDVNIVVVKLNQKSRKKNDCVDNDYDDQQYGSSSNLSSNNNHYNQNHHHHHHHHRHQHQHHQDLPQSQHCSALLGQQELTFHCPTGKSWCSFSSALSDLKSDAGHHSKVKTLDCIWTQDTSRCRARKLKGEAKFETSGKFITKWDILSHLTQVHQISVAQHYTDFGQAVRLQLLQNFKSIPCITIQSEHNWTRDLDKDKENLNQAFMSSDVCSEKVQGHRHKTTFHPRDINQTRSTELFFVACIPLEDVEHDNDAATKTTDSNLKEEEGFHRNFPNDMHADSGGDIPPTYVGNTTEPASVVVAGVPQGACIGVIKTETKSKSTRKGTHSQTTSHLIQDSSSTESTATLQSQWVEKCPTDSHTCTGYRNSSLGVDVCNRRSLQSSPRSSSSSSSSSSLATYSMSCSASCRCCCSSSSSPSDDDHVVSRQHAIFIWYFGNECDVKNFQTVIECKRAGLKWTGCVHPLTRSWSSLRQRRGQQLRHMEQQFLVLNLMPDGGDIFFDIVIKIK